MKGSGCAQTWDPTAVFDCGEVVGTEGNHDQKSRFRSRNSSSSPLEYNPRSIHARINLSYEHMFIWHFRKGMTGGLHAWSTWRWNFLHDVNDQLPPWHIFMVLTGIYPGRLCENPERFKFSTSRTGATTLTDTATSLMFRVQNPEVSQDPRLLPRNAET